MTKTVPMAMVFPLVLALAVIQKREHFETEIQEREHLRTVVRN